MNYYRRYVGDYLRDTSRLSMLEHGAYNLLLDYYYADEMPLPLDHEDIYRIVRALRTDEKKAIDRMLSLYFVAGDDGYRNGRADEELDKAVPLIEAARVNGKRGGRPKKKKPKNNPADNPAGFENETQRITRAEPVTYPVNNHPPITNNQYPVSIIQPPINPLARNFARFWSAYPKKRSKGDAEKAFKKLNPSEQLVAIIVSTIEQAKTSEDWRKENGKYIPYPASWLNSKGWEDEFSIAAQRRAVV